MKESVTIRGRPRTSPLTRAEQLRAAKREQRRRQRQAGLVTGTPRFRQSLDRFLRDEVLDLNEWPALRELAWNRANRWIPAEEALALYERNWRFVKTDSLTRKEANLINHLKERCGNGVLNV